MAICLDAIIFLADKKILLKCVLCFPCLLNVSDESKKRVDQCDGV